MIIGQIDHDDIAELFGAQICGRPHENSPHDRYKVTYRSKYPDEIPSFKAQN